MLSSSLLISQIKNVLIIPFCLISSGGQEVTEQTAQTIATEDGQKEMMEELKEKGLLNVQGEKVVDQQKKIEGKATEQNQQEVLQQLGKQGLLNVEGKAKLKEGNQKVLLENLQKQGLLSKEGTKMLLEEGKGGFMTKLGHSSIGITGQTSIQTGLTTGGQVGISGITGQTGMSGITGGQTSLTGIGGQIGISGTFGTGSNAIAEVQKTTEGTKLLQTLQSQGMLTTQGQQLISSGLQTGGNSVLTGGHQAITELSKSSSGQNLLISLQKQGLMSKEGQSTLSKVQGGTSIGTSQVITTGNQTHGKSGNIFITKNVHFLCPLSVIASTVSVDL